MSEERTGAAPAPEDTDLAKVAAAWPKLPEALRKEILDIVAAAGRGRTHVPKEKYPGPYDI